jgi:hypothetical protein
MFSATGAVERTVTYKSGNREKPNWKIECVGIVKDQIQIPHRSVLLDPYQIVLWVVKW